MSIAEAILEKVNALPPDKRAEVLDFAEFLGAKLAREDKRPRKNLLGALAHLNASVSREDIDEARREMWGNFPREDI
jgi:hypothetical protein